VEYLRVGLKGVKISKSKWMDIRRVRELCWVCVIFFWHFFASIFGWFSAHGFLFLVKELGLLTNMGYWMLWDPIHILYCKQCMIR
jgi:hypothetical protein